MHENLNNLFRNHIKWLDSEGKIGAQLVLENISSDQLAAEQLQLLTDSVLIECSFSNSSMDRIDLYHTELYSCRFTMSSFCETNLIKSEINDTNFINTSFDGTTFSKAEIFDCIFLRCAFKKSSFISAGIWNSKFDGCTFENIDFESVYVENVIFSNSSFINPINLEKATKLTINVGTADQPILLSQEESVKWIIDHIVS